MGRVACTFRLDPAIKAEFQANCKKNGYPMGIMLEVMMEKYNHRQRYYRDIKRKYEQKIAKDRLEQVKRGVSQ